MDTPSAKRESSWLHPFYLLSMLLVLLAGCASTQPQARHFFLSEEELETHGRKTWYDQVIDADPGGATFVIAKDYQERPPRKIAVLPFVDAGNGSYLINGLPLKKRDQEELNRWSWTHTNRLRRAFAGELGTREFLVVPLIIVDAVLTRHGVTDSERLKAVSPEVLGNWLDVDTVVYGEVLGYEAYYGVLVSAWRISTRVSMVSTLDRHEIFSCTNHRYDSNVRPAIGPIDILINAISSLIHLRDITLAHTEYEVGHEIAMRLPRVQRNISDLLNATTEGTTRSLASSSSGATSSQESMRTFGFPQCISQSVSDPSHLLFPTTGIRR